MKNEDPGGPHPGSRKPLIHIGIFPFSEKFAGISNAGTSLATYLSIVTQRVVRETDPPKSGANKKKSRAVPLRGFFPATRRNARMKKKVPGVEWIELMIVIVVIGMVAAMFFPQYK